MAYSNIIGRADVSDAMVPTQVSSEILQEAPKESVMLQYAKRVPLSKAKAKQPVLGTLPDAYWVDGDTGLKKTSKADWSNLTMTAEELAVIVPIPDALISDSDVPLWDEIKPLIREAIGQKIDAAAIFGTDKPASWPTSIVAGATAAKNNVVAGTGDDLGVDIAALGGKVAEQGYAVNGFISQPGLNWQLVGMRSATGQPIYAPSMAAGQPSTLYGYALGENYTGAWEADKATMIGLDWSKQLIGVRQDITYDLFSEGVISDSDGKVVLNLMQQDTKALRVVMRVGWQTAAPKTRVGKGTIYPAGVLTPAPAGGGEG
ncbi:phage major capsid protein [Corynebacterium sp.]|uniref:phage major capsid protein n=1 Tax=Corynebacterium sp. TaxID=1720 RepID=UPI0028A5F083|nr:phage major capsid protein [Corynebacterium sp.]